MIDKKNICITINSLASGGAEKQALLLAKGLKEYHNTVLVILNPKPIYQPYLDVIQEEQIDHVFLSSNPLKKTISFISLLKKRKTDIVFSFLPKDTIFSGICGKLAGVPFMFGGIRNSYVPKMKFRVLKMVHNSFLSYTIANNFAAYKAAINFGFKDKVFVIPNGIEIKPLKENLQKDKDVITIITLGRLVPQKDYETALKTIAELKKTVKQGVKLKYRIVGSGQGREGIVANIEKYGLQDEVELISNPPSVYDLLETSDIYLCTSIFEGFSNALMEALNCGLPVVATDAGDNSRLVIHEKNGFITELKDSKKLSEHLNYLIDSPEERAQMGKDSYRYLVDSFSYEVFQNKYVNIVKNIERIQVNRGEYIEQ